MVKKDWLVTFACRIEESQRDAFLAYLRKNYAGVTDSDKFRSFVGRVVRGDLVLHACLTRKLPYHFLVLPF